MNAITQLDFPAPRCKAAAELVRLLGTRDQLEAKLDALDAEQRVAADTLAQRSAELTALERRRLEGGQVSAAQRSKAEDALAQAKTAHAAPWAERRQALREAINNHANRVQTFVAEHFAELIEEVEADGAKAAQAVDVAATKLVAAYHERDRASQRLDGLLAVTRGASRFGDVATSRADALVREATGLLRNGGEAAPRVRSGIVPGRDVAEDDSQVEEAVSA